MKSISARFGPVSAALAVAFTIAQIAVDAAPAAATDKKELTTPDTDIAKKKGSLSDKLNSSNGVIHPDPSVDPGIQKPTPPAGAMPVVPPPGSPGGDPTVQPK